MTVRPSYFVRFDADGVIVASGVMDTAHIEVEREAGGRIIAVESMPPLDGSYIVRDGVLVKADA